MNQYEQDIPVGEDNAISRAELARLWGVDQRAVRAIIHNLRAVDNGDPYIIVSSSHGHLGYFRTDDPSQIRHFMRETKSRAINTFVPLKKARRVLEEHAR